MVKAESPTEYVVLDIVCNGDDKRFRVLMQERTFNVGSIHEKLLDFVKKHGTNHLKVDASILKLTKEQAEHDALVSIQQERD